MLSRSSGQAPHRQATIIDGNEPLRGGALRAERDAQAKWVFVGGIDKAR